MVTELNYGQVYRFGNWFPAKRVIYFGKAVERRALTHTVILRDEYDHGTAAKFIDFELQKKEGTEVLYIVPKTRPKFVSLNKMEREFVEGKLNRAGIRNESE